MDLVQTTLLTDIEALFIYSSRGVKATSPYHFITMNDKNNV